MAANGTIQRFVSGHQVPSNAICPWCLICTLFLVKRASQSESQSCEMESNDVFLRAGNRWASSAAFGRPGMLSWAVCVDCMVL